jgi:hypothetical protein
LITSGRKKLNFMGVMKMNYQELGPSSKTALVQLLYLEETSKLRVLSKPEQVDKVSIQASVAPLKTTIIPELERKEVLDRVIQNARTTKRK